MPIPPQVWVNTTPEDHYIRADTIESVHVARCASPTNPSGSEPDWEVRVLTGSGDHARSHRFDTGPDEEWASDAAMKLVRMIAQRLTAGQPGMIYPDGPSFYAIKPTASDELGAS